MKTPLLLLLLSLALPAAAAGDPPPPHDGDTMYVAPGPDTPSCSRLRWGEWESVRILGIDTPEMDGDCPSERAQAEAARTRLIELLGSGEVSLEREGCDRYERTLARVYVAKRREAAEPRPGPDRTDVATALISEGLGRPYDGGHRAGWCGSSEDDPSDRGSSDLPPVPRPKPARA